MAIKNFLKYLIPPVLINILNLIKYFKYGWFGNYSSWEEAQTKCKGYDNETIISKVVKATTLVKLGEASYERDSMVFNKIDYPFSLLSSLLYIIAKDNNYLNVIDFGGALGSTYYQNRKIISSIVSKLRWNIIEQKSLVEIGKKTFENEEIRFFTDILSCTNFYEEKEKPNLILFSSVLQYLDKPFEIIRQTLSQDFDYILIDRTAFIVKGKDRITVQRVSPKIYAASYPAWFFNEENFLEVFREKYNLVYDFISSVKEEETYLINYRIGGYGKGFFFERKNDV